MGAIIRLTMALNIGLGTALALLAYTVAPVVPRLYSPDPSIHATGTPLVEIVAILLLLNVVIVSAGSLLRGLGNMSAPFLFPAVAHWLVSLPLGYVIGMTGLLGAPWGAQGWWAAFGAGLLTAAVLLSVRLSRDAATAHASP